MCRSLYVLEHGRVASKPEAAGWAMDTLGQPWRCLVSAATAWRPGIEFNKLEQTLDFIQFTLSACQSTPVYTIIAPDIKEEDR